MKIFKKNKKEIEKSEIQKEIEDRLKDISESREEEQNVLDSFDAEIKDLVKELIGTTDPDEYKDTLNRLERLIEAKEGYNSQINDEIENLKKLVEVKTYVEGEKRRKLDPNTVLQISAMLIALLLTLFHEKINIIPKNGWNIFTKFLPNLKN